MKHLLLPITLLFGGFLNAQDVYIPDANFKSYLIGNSFINTNMDNEIQVSEALAFTGQIDVFASQITDMTGIEAFENITSLECHNNQITGYLDLSNCTALTSVVCNANQLSNINVSGATGLTSLNCNNNQLTALNVSNNTNLATLWFANNQITHLDLSNHTALTSLSAINNSLTQLNVQNGNNTNFTTFLAYGNSGLSCIQVDDVAFSNANWSGDVDAGASFSTNCAYNCLVAVPDANFKAYLLGNTSINTNMDTEIQCSEANTFTGTISCNSSNIADLTGIEAFTNLDELICANNQIASVDFSNNTALTNVHIGNNQLTTLDVSTNSNLTELNCGLNNLTSLTLNTVMYDLECHNNQLTSLDVSNCPNLALLYTQNNLLTTLDLSSNADIGTVNCSDNNLTSLDVTAPTTLNQVWCSNNNISTLILGSQSSFWRLYCDNNALTQLDISGSPAIQQLLCNDNQLTSLNVANGNNSMMSNNNFNATNNTALTCIQVDDVTYSTTNWTNIDAGASFSDNCCTVDTSVTANGLTFTATQAGATYQWVDCNNGNSPIAGATSQSYTATANGSYACIINDGTCSDTSSCYTVSGLGIDDLTSTFDLYPNPVSNILNVELDGPAELIRILDMRGQEVLRTTENTLDLTHCEAGIYLIEIYTNGQQLVSRFVKK